MENLFSCPNTFVVEFNNGASYDGHDLDFISAIEYDDEIEVSDHYGNVLHINKLIKPECHLDEDEITYVWTNEHGTLSICFLF